MGEAPKQDAPLVYHYLTRPMRELCTYLSTEDMQ